MTKIGTILFLCMIFDISFLNAQCISPKPSTGVTSIKNTLSFQSLKNAVALPLMQIPANFYSSNLGFFCKKEWKLETATKIPFRFRLGSLAYNDWLEGKPNTSMQR